MFAQASIKLIGPVDHLRIVWQTGEALLDSVVFDEDSEGTRYNILLALQEMVTNVLRHGYQLDDANLSRFASSCHAISCKSSCVIRALLSIRLRMKWKQVIWIATCRPRRVALGSPSLAWSWMRSSTNAWMGGIAYA